MPSPRSPRGRRAPAAAESLSVFAEAMIEALMQAGGSKYLQGIAEKDPKSFCALLVKVLPQQADTPSNIGITLEWQPDFPVPDPSRHEPKP